MTPEPWKKVEKLYNAALERDPGEREAFLEEACGEDGALLDEVKSLLAADEQAERFIEEPAAAAATQAVNSGPGQSWAGRQIGTYEVVSLLGAGGMGEVYRARDPRLDREVAIKVVLARGTSDPERLRRLEREARAAGSLNHPNIVAVYDRWQEL